MSQAYTGGEVRFDDSLWQTPAVSENEPADILGPDALLEVSDSRIHPILYNGVPFQGKQTKVFAYVGFPEGASERSPVPAVVLVHGGEGTAFWDWVKLWLDRGYAAIAMDTEGRFPVMGSEMATGYRALLPEEIRGPQNSGWYADGAFAVREQWMYHAVSSAIAANSYLRGCPQVDSDKIGIVGVSWGGVICSITNIYDDRFAFAAPIYGALGMAGTFCNFGNIYASMPRAQQLWDNAAPLADVSTPTFYVNGGNDYHFNVQGNFLCASATQNSRVLVKRTLDHSQYSAASVREVYAFADHITARKMPFINITQQPTAKEPVLKLDIPRGVSVEKAELIYSDTEQAVRWQTTELIAGKEIGAEIPQGTKFFFFNITDTNGFSFSTQLQKI